MKTQLPAYHLPKRHYLAGRRIPKHFKAAVKYQLLLDGIEYKGRIGNMDVGGAYLKLMEPPITESQLFQEGEILINMPFNHIRVRCHITYVGTGQSEYPTGVGVGFIDPDEYAIAKIIGEGL